MEIFLSVLLIIPFFWIFVFMQNKLSELKSILLCLIVGIITAAFGLMAIKYNDFENPGAFYLLSQLSFSFVVVFGLYRIPYNFIFKREPVVSHGITHMIDFLSILIVVSGTIFLPIFLDYMFFNVIHHGN